MKVPNIIKEATIRDANFRTGSKLSLWQGFERILATAALVTGCCFFIGHRTLEMSIWEITDTIYPGMILNLFDYDQVLIEGIIIVFNVLMPWVVSGACFSYLAYWLSRENSRRRLVLRSYLYILGTLYIIVMIVTPISSLNDYLFILVPRFGMPITVFTAFLFVGVVLQSEQGNLIKWWPLWVSRLVFMGGILYFVWLFPFLLPYNIISFPEFSLKLKDGTKHEGLLIAQKQASFTFFDADSSSLLIVPSAQVLAVVGKSIPQTQNMPQKLDSLSTSVLDQGSLDSVSTENGNEAPNKKPSPSK